MRTTRTAKAAVNCGISKDNMQNKQIYLPLHAYFPGSYKHAVKLLI